VTSLADPLAIPQEIAVQFARLPYVAAVALAGSQGSQVADRRSDFDIYVYTEHAVSPAWRADLARPHGSHIAIDNHFWETGDDWFDNRVGAEVDIMYRAPQWIEEQLDRSLVHHEATTGYSTCFWFNVLHSTPLYDRDGWYAGLQDRARQPYPAALRQAIIAKNHPILRTTNSSYVQQIELALLRGDFVSINHRVATLLASYFDILFALNNQPHPGEKRLIGHTQARCPKRPADFEQQIDDLLNAAAPVNSARLLPCAHALLDGLDALLAAHAQLPYARHVD
jgi:hypothetical protein